MECENDNEWSVLHLNKISKYARKSTMKQINKMWGTKMAIKRNWGTAQYLLSQGWAIDKTTSYDMSDMCNKLQKSQSVDL